MIGAALFYGDGMITPAISVLSAIEGLEIIAPALEHYVVPLSLLVLVGLFLAQSRGTEAVGRLFGPIMAIWFGVLALLGLWSLIQNPEILAALDPRLAIGFVAEHRFAGFVALGAVVLAITGCEALFADMGHFGRRPIHLAWFGLVMPCLMLNYLGQGALLLRNPEAARNPFYLLAPDWALWPMVVLATLATVIASQAVISGAFSLTRQAVQLGLMPRIGITHTSESEIGQIYIPRVNWVLMVCVAGLVLGFRSSSALASAYGIAVTGTMIADSLFMAVVARRIWRWNRLGALVLPAAFFAVDIAFFGACSLKIEDGGWFPLVIAFGTFVLLSTWWRGREILAEQAQEASLPMLGFAKRLEQTRPTRVLGTAIYMCANPDNVPHAMLHNLKHNKVLHERIVLLNVTTEDVPRVPGDRRIEFSSVGPDMHRIVLRYGFKETPDVLAALADCARFGFAFDLMKSSFFLGREKLVPGARSKMALWRDWLFIWMSRNALSATDFFRIPSNAVIELGAQVEI
jgi:KUP system potassium uptake protein